MLQGKRQLAARLDAVGDTRVLLRRIQIEGVREAKLLVPRRTGNLGRTIRLGDVNDSHCEIVAGGQNRVGYAGAVELGSRPRVITPKRAKALAWGGKRTLGGRLRAGQKPQFFARSVKHPGNKAKPFLVPGLKKAAERNMGPVIVEVWNRAA